MDKKSIYQIIGYQGEYTEKIKKSLKKLLKENHPDHGGDPRIFDIITTVKKELESGKVSYHVKKNEINYEDDLDYDYCLTMIKTLQKKITNKENDILQMQKDLDDVNNKYKKIYRKSLDNEASLLNNTNEIKKLTALKKRMIFLLVILVITFTVAILKNELIIFGLFVFFAIITIINVRSFYVTLNCVNKKNNGQISKYFAIVHRMRDYLSEKETLEKDLIKEERILHNMQNDLRFYNNLVKKTRGENSEFNKKDY